MSKLLEQFDGVSAKNKEVMVLMTSNHVDSLSKGMTRVGRIDAAIEIGSLDREGIERLISSTFDDNMLSGAIDFEAIYESMQGYEPAFIMGTFNLTKNNAIIRSGSLDFQLTTEDFVLAADTLRNQHDTHHAAADRPAVDTFGESFSTVVTGVVQRELQGHKVDFQNNGEIVSVE
jgi:ATP-dependent 26S proteasome regulatory subunit